jgi:hypothetical protein
MLIGVECDALAGTKCVLTEQRQRRGERVHYTFGLMILFAECFWYLGLDLEEAENVGEREGAVARTVLERNELGEAEAVLFDPYDRRWDGLLPLENDPLTRIRLLSLRLRDSIQLGDRALALELFEVDDEGN